MSLSLYEISIPKLTQILGTVDNMLTKAALHFNERGINLEDVLDYRLVEDQKPLRSQIVYANCFATMAMESLKTGEFIRTNDIPDDHSYTELHHSVRLALDTLNKYTPGEVNALTDNEVMIVTLPDVHDPFTAANFILSFAYPNVHFHATTVYDILRRNGVPLEKRDIIGMFRREMSVASA